MSVRQSVCLSRWFCMQISKRSTELLIIGLNHGCMNTEHHDTPWLPPMVWSMYSCISLCAGGLPGPVLFGFVIDHACLLWEQKCDGSTGACLHYDNHQMAWLLFAVCAVCKLLNIVCGLIAWRTYKRLKGDIRKQDSILCNDNWPNGKWRNRKQIGIDGRYRDRRAQRSSLCDWQKFSIWRGTNA